MFGGAAFGTIYFGQAFWEVPVTADETPRGGHYAKTGKRRKRKKQELPNWNAVIWPEEPTKPVERTPEPVMVSPAPAPETRPTDQPRPIFQPTKALADALSGKAQLDAATRRQVDEYKRRMRMEMEDEEALLLLGAFD